MKKCFVLVLITLVVVGGGSPDWAVGEEVVDYPEEMWDAVEWTQTVDGGFELGYRMMIWNPMRSTENFKHPHNGNIMIERYEVAGRDTWVIPFTLFIRNETIGFGSYTSDTVIGNTLNMHVVEQLRRDYNTGLWLIMGSGSSAGKTFSESARQGIDATPYMASVFVNSDHNKMYDAIRMTWELAEGVDNSFVYGYFVFADAKRTPNMPNGVDDGWFEKGGGRRIAVGDYVPSTRMYICKMVAKVNRIEGELVLSSAE